MAAKDRIKQPAIAVLVPQDRDAVVAAIAEIGHLTRRRVAIETAMNEALAVIRQQHEEQAYPLAERVKALSQGVQVWCEANRATLTQGGKIKSHKFASGTVNWRTSTPRVVIRSVEAVLEILRQMRLDRFIRLKPEINKEAILNDPESVRDLPGLSIKQDESFSIEPFETSLEEVS